MNFKNGLKKIINWLFPYNATCIGCGGELFVRNDRFCLCEDCTRQLIPIKNCCQRCGKATEYGEYCQECKSERIYFDRAYSCLLYEGIIRKIIINFKFKNKRYYAKALASFYIDKIIEKTIDCDIITSVPISKEHKIERGFNQSALIAREISERIGIPFVDKVLKKERTRQVGKNWKERKKNAENAYYVKSPEYEGKVVLAIDDIITTGSTMNNFAKALKRAGATKVIGLTLCSAYLKSRRKSIDTPDF